MQFLLRPLALLGLIVLMATPSMSAQTVSRTNVTSQVTFGWNPVADPTANGYNLYYGAASNTYTNVTFVPGAGTSIATLVGFTRGTTYFFTITTMATNGLESVYGEEISWKSPGLPASPGGFVLKSSQ